MHTVMHRESQFTTVSMAVCSHTRVMVENDIEKILVSPGDVELIFLKQRHQQFLPPQWNRRHVILSPEKHKDRQMKAFFTEVQWCHLVANMKTCNCT